MPPAFIDCATCMATCWVAVPADGAPVNPDGGMIEASEGALEVATPAMYSGDIAESDRASCGWLCGVAGTAMPLPAGDGGAGCKLI